VSTGSVYEGMVDAGRRSSARRLTPRENTQRRTPDAQKLESRLVQFLSPAHGGGRRSPAA